MGESPVRRKRHRRPPDANALHETHHVLLYTTASVWSSRAHHANITNEVNPMRIHPRAPVTTCTPAHREVASGSLAVVVVPRTVELTLRARHRTVYRYHHIVYGFVRYTTRIRTTVLLASGWAILYGLVPYLTAGMPVKYGYCEDEMPLANCGRKV